MEVSRLMTNKKNRERYLAYRKWRRDNQINPNILQGKKIIYSHKGCIGQYGLKFKHDIVTINIPQDNEEYILHQIYHNEQLTNVYLVPTHQTYMKNNACDIKIQGGFIL